MTIPFSFLPIPEQIMADSNLSWGAKYLFGILAKTNWEKIHWSKRKLAERMNVGLEETRLRIKELESKGLIKVERKDGEINTYTVNLEILVKSNPPTNEGPLYSMGGVSNNVLGGIHIYKKDNLKDIYIQILSFFNEKMKQNFRLTEGVKEKLSVRLKSYSKEDLIKAIDNFSKNDWWMENNSFRGPAWFFKSDDQIERFLALKPEKGAHGVIVITNDGKVIHQK